MSWPLKEITTEELQEIKIPSPGMCWRVPVPDGQDHIWGHKLSDTWRASGRDYAIFVTLPATGDWCVDAFASDKSTGGWTVTGELPTITVTPSINAVGRYHGWVQNGVLTDDCEGRTFG